MIDLRLLREHPAQVRELLRKKDPSFPLDMLIAADEAVRVARVAVEELRGEKNKLSVGKPTPESIARSKEVGAALVESEAALAREEKKLNDIWLSCPNLPEEVVPVGNKESNKAVRSWGTEQAFSFTPQHHLTLNEKAQWFDLAVGTKIAGTSQFVYYTPMGTKIIYALTLMMLKNNAEHGYQPVLPPYVVSKESLYNAGNLPKFQGDFYELTENEGCLTPTAEVCLTNVHANEILAQEELPKRYTSWTSCFRREAGGYGALERGIIRIHQFEKVELFAITEPEKSGDELERMVACAESLLKKLGLAYQVSLLAGQDCSFSSAKTYDIEVWLPGQNRHYEVSSASNCTDFQARRAQIRYKGGDMKRPALAHTLNASSLAIPRLMVALMEQGQQADGSIVLPAELQKYMNLLW